MYCNKKVLVALLVNYFSLTSSSVMEDISMRDEKKLCSIIIVNNFFIL